MHNDMKDAVIPLDLANQVLIFRVRNVSWYVDSPRFNNSEMLLKNSSPYNL
jgi:hypothetical protein